MVGGSCGDDGSVVEVGMLGMDGSIPPVFGSSGGIVCSSRKGAYDGSVNFDGIGIVCSGGGRIPKCYCICLRMAVCWVWVAIICSWWHVELSYAGSRCFEKWSMSARCDIGL